MFHLKTAIAEYTKLEPGDRKKRGDIHCDNIKK
jgi:hypothetical protein